MLVDYTLLNSLLHLMLLGQSLSLGLGLSLSLSGLLHSLKLLGLLWATLGPLLRAVAASPHLE